MDPDTTLATILSAARRIRSAYERDQPIEFEQEGADLAQAILDLDGWLERGGFRPDRWA